MITRIEKISPQSLAEAKEIIFGGGVVAIPTETVYGLGGSAFDDEAVRRIFEIKGRPNDNPLIAHVHAEYDLKKIVDYDPPYAQALRRAFLPGPLTLVYPSAGKVSPFVSCGLDTLAVRVPSHEGAQAFLREVDIPVVAPSANLSRHVSPTTARHVLDDFEGQNPLDFGRGKSDGRDREHRVRRHGGDTRDSAPGIGDAGDDRFRRRRVRRVRARTETRG